MSISLSKKLSLSRFYRTHSPVFFVISCLLSVLLMLITTYQATAHNWRKQRLVLFTSYEITSTDIKMSLCLPDSLLNSLLSAPIDFNYALKVPLQESIRDQLKQRIQRDLSIQIDQVSVSPILDKLDIILTAPEAEINLKDLQVEGISVHSGLKGAAILQATYPLKESPKEVRFFWKIPTLFVKGGRRSARQLTSKVMPGLVVHGDEMSPMKFTPEEPEFIWRAPRKKVKPPSLTALQTTPPPTPTLPLISILFICTAIALSVYTVRVCGRSNGDHIRAQALRLGGWVLFSLLLAAINWEFRPLQINNPWTHSDRLDDQTAQEIFKALHHNIYRAFDYQEDEMIYKALSESVSGELLDWMFQQIYRGLILRDEGGARARVSFVRPLKWERKEISETQLKKIKSIKNEQGALQRSLFSVRYYWRVVGEVTHWGHSHRRVNEYKALYSVAHTSKGWRIISVKVLAHSRRPELEGKLP